ncbi:MAG: AAA family ATPase [Candidatus Acidifodinimicrobium sp.]
MDKMIVLGLSALPGGGKDYIADLLVNEYGFYKVTPGDIVREIMKRKGIPITRENEQKIPILYRKKYGEYFLMKMVYRRAKESGKKLLVVSGIRTPGDLRFFREKLDGNFKNISIVCSARVRYNRIRERKREDAPKNFSEFLKQDKAERKIFKLDETKKLSDFTLKNEGNEAQLRRNLKKILKKSGLGYLLTK